MRKDVISKLSGLICKGVLILNATTKTKSSLIVLLMLFYIPLLASGEPMGNNDPWHIEAAFLRNFSHYVTWPESAFADNSAPWRICILGNDPFGELLENTFNGHTEQGRSFLILRSRNPTELRQCQIIYVAYIIGMSRRAALAELKGLPILTVSNAPDFLHEGGIIQFDVTDYVVLNVNLDQARAASLTIQTKMLEVSNKIIENGKVR